MNGAEEHDTDDEEPMFENVLVPVDGSPVAEQALPAALAVCRRAGGQLHLVHVRSHLAGERYPLAEDPVRAYLDDLATRVGADLGRPVSSTIMPREVPTLLKPAPAPETVAAMVAAYARRNGVDLMVLTTHGRSGLSRLWFGSVAEGLLRRSQIPLLLVRPAEAGEEDRWSSEQPLRRVLVATDGSDVSRHAVELAASFAKLFPAEITLLRVVPIPYEVLGGLSTITVAYTGQDANESLERAKSWLEREAATLRAAGVAVTTDVVIDPSPARVILEYTRDHAMDLVVLASRSRSGLDRFLIGSVADKVIRGGEAPLLVQQPDENEVAADNERLATEAETAET